MSEIRGFARPPFEKVERVFRESVERGEEVGASFAVYHRGELVVDLAGGHADRTRSRPWTGETLVNVWSTTKGMAALCCAMLVDRGLLDYGQPVAEIWPEFAAAGKGRVTLADLLAHRAGVPGVRERLRLEDLFDQEAMASRLAREEPFFEPGSRSGYHAITFGHLAGEIVRRVTGRSLGRFFREEVAAPLGLDFHIGLPEEAEPLVAELIGFPAEEREALPATPVRRAALGNPPVGPETPNRRDWRAAELPAANGQGTARALARAYAVLAAGGERFGVRLLSPRTLERATAVENEQDDLVLGLPMRWSRGFIRNTFGMYGPSDRAFGHSGFGGSYACADPDRDLAIAYTMNRMAANLASDPRGLRLLGAVHAALGAD